MAVNAENPPLVTRSRLIQDFTNLGVRPEQVVMLHASVKAVGWVVGGPDVILHALRDVLGPEGTLMMMVGWEDHPYEMDSWPEEKRRAYLQECPPFDPATSRAHRPWSILTEYLRTTPGARRSANPEKSMAAIGAKADWLTADHPLDYGFGPGSPLDKLCRVGGQVLLLGTPFDSVTLLHYAECLANVPDKRVVRYRMPILRDGQAAWVDIEEFDTSDGIRDWAGGDYFRAIVEEYLAAGHGRTGLVGAARSYLFDAPELVRFGVNWMERTFAQAANHDVPSKEAAGIEGTLMVVEFRPIDPEDEVLIAAAADVLGRNYHPVRHTVGAAVLCPSGRIYAGINLEACGYGPCAEPIAIGTAFSAGERAITTIVAVSRSEQGYGVLSPCGNCRQLVLDYAPDAIVIFDLDGQVVKAPARLLLPGFYRSDF